MSAEWSQPELVAANGRRFAGFAAAVVVFIIDPSTRRFLLVSSPAKRGREGWESVSGGLEGGESLMVGLRREYLGGEVIPGDDMAGCAARWATLDEVKGLAAAGTALVPDEVWMFERALQCFDLWSPGAVDVD